MTPLQSLNDDLASHIGEMRIVMDEMGEALDYLLTAHGEQLHDAFDQARRALSAYERVRKLYSETTGDAS